MLLAEADPVPNGEVVVKFTVGIFFKALQKPAFNELYRFFAVFSGIRG
jgi:hypothetical protein